jgi:hypothetical protein
MEREVTGCVNGDVAGPMGVPTVVRAVVDVLSRGMNVMVIVPPGPVADGVNVTLFWNLSALPTAVMCGRHVETYKAVKPPSGKLASMGPASLTCRTGPRLAAVRLR